jgi:hypothetical protein
MERDFQSDCVVAWPLRWKLNVQRSRVLPKSDFIAIAQQFNDGCFGRRLGTRRSQCPYGDFLPRPARDNRLNDRVGLVTSEPDVLRAKRTYTVVLRNAAF